MYIEQLYTSCLAEAAYYIESDGEVAIIDPLREASPYIELAAKRNAKIKYVFETHFHADFVSGHIDLSNKTGAIIVYGPTAAPDYNAYIASDCEQFTIGKIKIKVLHTPGHTMESSCYLLLNEAGNAHAVFTGDTLFVGDVGRPDLAVKSDLSQEDLAGMLYDSLYSRIITLPDEVIVYPAHGAGSSCGKNIGKETFSTIGHQKKYNYALQPMFKAEFIQVVTEGLAPPPAYFFHDAMINKKGYESLDLVIARNNTKLSPEAFDTASKKDGVLILDTRDPDEFEKGFIPGAINIGLNGQYAPWVGALIPAKSALLLVTAQGKEEEAILRLARIGYENVIGILEGGLEAWKKEGKTTNQIDSITPSAFIASLNKGIKVLDVRKKGEREAGIIDGAIQICLSDLLSKIDGLEKSTHYYVHCAGGYRSMMAASLLKKYGFNSVTNVYKGMAGIKATGGVELVIPELV
jgi:hydroxyacylglutathione hydrolase